MATRRAAGAATAGAGTAAPATESGGERRAPSPDEEIAARMTAWRARAAGADVAGQATGAATGTAAQGDARVGCAPGWVTADIVETFDFGQFINLVVLDSDTGQTLDSILHNGLQDPKATADAARRGDRDQPLSSAFGGVSILDIARGHGAAYTVTLKDLILDPGPPVDPLATESVTVKAKVRGRGPAVEHVARLDDAARAQLAAGLPVVVPAYAPPETSGAAPAPVLVTVEPKITEVALDHAALASVLASKRVTVGRKSVDLDIGPAQIQALLDGEAVVARSAGDAPGLVRLAPPGTSDAPAVAADSFHIVDVAGFLAAPHLLDTTGRPIAITLDAEQITALLSGHASVTHDGQTVGLSLTRSGPALPLGGAGTPPPIAGGEPSLTVTGAPLVLGAAIDRTQVTPLTTAIHAFPQGLEAMRTIPATLPPITVSLYIPWTQTWRLHEYSRGRLVQSVTMAPGEEVTIELLTWDRTRKNLDRTSQTDSDQTFDTSVTTKDTDDVLQELANQSDFQLHGQGGVSATVKPGFGEITTDAQIGAETKNGINTTCKKTGQTVHESAIKASVRVAQHRVSRVTETHEFGREERTTRKLRNPNMCHDLEIRYYEVRANYEVTTALDISGAQLCALVENPLSTGSIDAPLVRRNETAFRNALLDPALADGFEALRMLEAYAQARRIVTEQATVLATEMAGTDANAPTSQDRARTQGAQVALTQAQTGTGAGGGPPATPPEPTAVPSPPLPSKEEQAVHALLAKIFEAIDQLASAGNEHITHVMTCFARHASPEEPELVLFRRSLFWRLLQSTAASLHSYLADLAEVRTLPIANQPDWALLAKAAPHDALLKALAANWEATRTRPKQANRPADGPGRMTTAKKILACMGDGMAMPGVAGLAGLPDGRKEELVLSGIIRQAPWFGAEADWAWWSGTLRDHALYAPDDCGLAALLGDLQEAMRAFNAAEGSRAALEGFGTPAEALGRASGRQDRSEATDRLDQAFGLVDLANASERADALLRHITDHSDYYRYTLFQALPPSEQLDKILAVAGGNLPVGLFEPRVIAMSGAKLAIPLARGVAAALDDWTADLLADVAADLKDPDRAIEAGGRSTTSLPTPALTAVMSLGRCSGCEDFIEDARAIDLEVQRAKAAQEWLEAVRLDGRIAAGVYDDPRHPADGITLRMDDLRRVAAPATPSPAPAAPAPLAAPPAGGGGAPPP